MKILVTGGTGFLGSELADELIRQGHELVMSTRSLSGDWDPYPAQFVKWPLDVNELEPHLKDIEACIHLVGESIAGKRWTPEQKKKILSSRVQGTKDVVDVLRLCPKLKVFLSSSAVGIYGNGHDEEKTESSKVGKGFLAEVCDAWEIEAGLLDRPEVRTVLLRTGVVMGRGSGFLGQLEPIFKNNMGGVLGDGKQFISWIHLQDWVKACVHCLTSQDLKGPVNLTAPQPVSNRDFTYCYGDLIGQWIYPPAPAFAVRLALGEQAVIALEGQYVIPKKLMDDGFRFQFPELKPALEDLYDISDLYNKVDEFQMARQYLPYPIEEVFQFFSSEKNLEKITPPMLGFEVLNKNTPKITEGTLINYKLKIHGIPARWQTRIEEWNPPNKFVDTQLKGPYARWHHTHTFEKLGPGTLIKDKVHFRLPMGCLGRIAALWLVRQDVKKIFDYRRKVIGDIFPT